MIITRSPLRITLGGGGTDLPSYYAEHGGFLVAAAIDKYVYITVHQTFVPDLIVKYSKLERVAHARDVQHPIIRECLLHLGLDGSALEIASMADIPAGTGLGSSGSFTTALLKALHAHKKNLVHPRELAEQACHVEIERLHEPIGKQDQYIAAFGGLTCFRFLRDGRVEAWPLRLEPDTLHTLEDNLLLFFTGYSRQASEILREQDQKSKPRHRRGHAREPALREGARPRQLRGPRGRATAPRFGELMNVHWEHKKKRSGSMSNPAIDEWYELALRSGALGGKLIGAGGGGFLMFYAEDRRRLRQALGQAGLREVRFRFDFEGTRRCHPVVSSPLLPRCRWRSWRAAWPPAWGRLTARHPQGPGRGGRAALRRPPAGPAAAARAAAGGAVRGPPGRRDRAPRWATADASACGACVFDGPRAAGHGRGALRRALPRWASCSSCSTATRTGRRATTGRSRAPSRRRPRRPS